MSSFLRFFQWKARRATSRSAEWNKIKEDLRLRQADRDELARMNLEDTLKVQTLELKVKIHCHGCLKSVKKALRNIDGVYESTVDAATGKVTVSGLMDPDTVMKKLRKAGKRAELWGETENNPAVVTQFQKLQLGASSGGNGQQQANDAAGVEGLQQLPKGGAGAGAGGVMVVPLPTVKQMEGPKFPPGLMAIGASDDKTNDEDLKDDNDDIQKMLMKRLGMPPATVGGGNGGGNTNNGSGKKEGQANENGGSSQNGNGAGGALALGSGNQPGPAKKKKKKSGGSAGAGLHRPMMPPQEAAAGMMMTMPPKPNMMGVGIAGFPGMGQQIGGGGILGMGAVDGVPRAAGVFTDVGGMPAAAEMLPMPQLLPPPQQQEKMMMSGNGHHDYGGYPLPPASGYEYGYRGLPAMPEDPPAYYYPVQQGHPHDSIFSDENPDAGCSLM